MKKIILLFSSMLLALSSCGGRQSQTSVSPVDTITTFSLPEIPVMFTEPEQRLAYVIQHFWDRIDFADTNYVHHPEITEQAWADYVNLLPQLPPAKADATIKTLFKRLETSPVCFHYMTDLAEQYLYHPNSPLRNEELYISVLDAVLASSVLTDDEKIRPQGQRTLAEKNRPGRVAEDFTYTLADGSTHTLHGLKAPYILLCINTPGCEACTQMISDIRSSEAIGAATKKGLRILSVYPDEEVDFWREHVSEYPSSWIAGYDDGQIITHRQLYDLRAVPTIYLLDAQKRVLLKDATIGTVNDFLSNL